MQRSGRKKGKEKKKEGELLEGNVELISRGGGGEKEERKAAKEVYTLTR